MTPDQGHITGVTCRKPVFPVQVQELGSSDSLLYKWIDDSSISSL